MLQEATHPSKSRTRKEEAGNHSQSQQTQLHPVGHCGPGSEKALETTTTCYLACKCFKKTEDPVTSNAGYVQLVQLAVDNERQVAKCQAFSCASTFLFREALFNC